MGDSTIQHGTGDDAHDPRADMGTAAPLGAPVTYRAVPIRQVIGAAPRRRPRWLAVGAIATAGWLMSGGVVAGGGVAMWHLLFGDSVGGDVWLGQPPDWVAERIEAGQDPADPPGGEPWHPQQTAPSTAASAPALPATTVVVAIPAPSVTTPASGAEAADDGGGAPSGGAQSPTATTVVVPIPTATTTAPPPAVTTTVPATTVVSTTSPSTTIDDDVDDDDSGSDNSGKGGGGGSGD